MVYIYIYIYIYIQAPKVAIYIYIFKRICVGRNIYIYTSLIYIYIQAPKVAIYIYIFKRICVGRKCRNFAINPTVQLTLMIIWSIWCFQDKFLSIIILRYLT